MSDPHAYQFAFRVGWMGSVVLAVYSYLGNTLAGFSALSLWMLIMLFVLPWVYLLYEDNIGQIPDWAVRGPHQ